MEESVSKIYSLQRVHLSVTHGKASTASRDRKASSLPPLLLIIFEVQKKEQPPFQHIFVYLLNIQDGHAPSAILRRSESVRGKLRRIYFGETKFLSLRRHYEVFLRMMIIPQMTEYTFIFIYHLVTETEFNFLIYHDRLIFNIYTGVTALLMYMYRSKVSAAISKTASVVEGMDNNRSLRIVKRERCTAISKAFLAQQDFKVKRGVVCGKPQQKYLLFRIWSSNISTLLKTAVKFCAAFKCENICS